MLNDALRYDRRRALRHAIAAVFVLTVAALFVQREVLSDGAAGAKPGPAATAVARLGPFDERTVETGQPAPDFVLTAREGPEQRLSDFRGRVVVLNFWASWCGPCRQEMPEFERAYAEHRERGDLSIVAVNLLAQDSKEAALEFLQELGITFPVLFDADGEVARRYNVRGLPSTFFIDREGVVRAATYGPVVGGLLERGLAAAGLEG